MNVHLSLPSWTREAKHKLVRTTISLESIEKISSWLSVCTVQYQSQSRRHDQQQLVM